MNDGFMERILYSCPEKCTDAPNEGVAIPKEIKERLADACENLFENRISSKDRLVRLTKEARYRFVAAEREWHEKIHSPDFPSEMEAFYAKMPSQLGRLILILHEMKRAVGQTNSDLVDEKTVSEAKQMADYFLAHAHIALGMLTLTREELQVDKAMRWIQKRGMSVVSIRDIITFKVAGCNKKTTAMTLMKNIHDYGYGYFNQNENQLIVIPNTSANQQMLESKAGKGI